MVKGLDVFLTHFRFYNNRFVLIGVTACDMAKRSGHRSARPRRDDFEKMVVVRCLAHKIRRG